MHLTLAPPTSCALGKWASSTNLLACCGRNGHVLPNQGSKPLLKVQYGAQIFDHHETLDLV